MYQCPNCHFVGVGNCICPGYLRGAWPAGLQIRLRGDQIDVWHNGEDLGTMNDAQLEAYVKRNS